MDLHKALRTAYFAALSGNVQFQGFDVPIFDAFALAPEQKYPYILLSAQTSTQDEVKKFKNYNATMQVDVVTGSENPMGREQSELIMDQVESIIIPTTFEDLDLTPYGFTMHDTYIESALDDFNKSSNYYIYRKVTTYVHLISKN